MQPSGARDRVRGAANIEGDERRASGVTGPSAVDTEYVSVSANQSAPLPANQMCASVEYYALMNQTLFLLF